MDILVDLDPAVYACGFASQKTTYSLVLEKEDGEISNASFTAKQDESAGDQVKEFVKQLPEGWYVADQQKLVSPLPLTHCLHIVRRHVDTLTQAALARFGNCSVNYFLSGSGNYRYSVAKQRPYKGNRLPESRPYHYASIRKYMEEKWSPYISSGNEADDAISIAAEQSKGQNRDVCIVSIDKDLDQIPGWHYNPDKKVFYSQDRDSALCYFYQQALSGDSTDNIPGCFRIGSERAASLIAAWTEDYEGIGLEQEQALWRNIVGTYISSTGKRGCPYTEEQAEAVALETARLVYIQRAPNELWNPPGEEFGRTDSLL